MSLPCERCVLSGRGLCDELITCPEESHRLWCVVCGVCEVSEKAITRLGCSATKQNEKKKIVKLKFNFTLFFQYICTQPAENVRHFSYLRADLSIPF